VAVLGLDPGDLMPRVYVDLQATSVRATDRDLDLALLLLNPEHRSTRHGSKRRRGGEQTTRPADLVMGGAAPRPELLIETEQPEIVADRNLDQGPIGPNDVDLPFVIVPSRRLGLA
jgi:hypothetical protein